MRNNSGHWNIESGLTPSYNSDGCTVSGLSSWKCMSINQQFTSPVSMEFEIVSFNATGGASPLIEFKGQTHQSTNDHLIAYRNDGLLIHDKNGNTENTGNALMGIYRIDFESSTNVKIYYNNNQIYSSTNWNINNPYFTIGTGESRAFTFKNVKIKKL